MAWKWLQSRRSSAQWERMRRGGHVQYLTLWIVISIACYAAVRAAHVACFHFGWLSSPGSTTMEDGFVDAVLPGLISAQMHWTDMKKKFSAPSHRAGLTS
ncbi:hypothetical protein HDF16_002818 [Granulicella aggregans]|uniref:Uncharacterized protein n=1 Tax=Granulicella aggregans TaxID=474949 RepID=A0A7W8E401_9BACT|nr:hypothetical protein [Granulicella aggregans]